jgi:serine/threonine protein kinase
MNSKNTNIVLYSLLRKKGNELTSPEKDSQSNTIFFSKYKALNKIGEGSFGKVYKAIYDDEFYALKMEDPSLHHNLLENEAAVLKYLQGPNIPKYETYGYNKEHNILVMQLLDKSLDDILFKLKSFSIKTTAMLGHQMINILKYIHDKHIIHRDVKPDNFVMGRKELNGTLYIVDFGLAKKYRSSRTLKQLPLTKRKSLTGTARYASIHALQGYEQSRRDDLESVGYTLMYLLRGNLPWQSIKVKNKEEKYKKILNKKKKMSSKELGEGFPIEFAEILDHFKSLGYTENPDYETCCQKLLNVLQREKLKFDYVYDWTTYTNLKDRKKRPSHIRDNKHYSKRNTTHYLEDEDNEDNIKLKIEDIDGDINKKCDSSYSNRADIDEFDSPGLNPKNDTECCLM